MAHFIEIKIVSNNLKEINSLIKEYSLLGFNHNGIIQNDIDCYWAFVNKDFGLKNK